MKLLLRNRYVIIESQFQFLILNKSRLKLLIYSGLILSLISTVLNLSIKNYVQLAAVGSIAIYFGLVYSSLPSTIITCLSLCIIKGKPQFCDPLYDPETVQI